LAGAVPSTAGSPGPPELPAELASLDVAALAPEAPIARACSHVAIGITSPL
jgi:hypothetical protein